MGGSSGVTNCVNSCELIPAGAKEKPKGHGLPQHLRSLYERSVAYLSSQQAMEVYQLLNEFADTFSKETHDLGRIDLVKHQINTRDAAPIRQPPRRLPFAKRNEACRAIEEMCKQGVIEPSRSPWSSPVVLVKKSGGWRFCVDYRKLNDVTCKDSYPLPCIDESIEALSGAKLLSTLDLKSGYWQVELDSRDKEKTAFSLGNILWQFIVMPFGLANAPATFERLMEQVLMGLPWNTALIYLDDIRVAGKTFLDQLSHLRSVLQRLRDAGLKLAPEKCFLFQKEVKYLGHVVSEKGITTDPDKVEAVRTWPKPTSFKELHSFIGLCLYYRRFIAGFVDIVQPLYKCLEGSVFGWNMEANDAFQKLKHLLTGGPILGYPTIKDPFVLDTDASLNGVGAFLSQMQNGQERALSHYSHRLSKAERNYCITRRELLAIVKAIRRFHLYLYGRSFTFRTDHAALRWLLHELQVSRGADC